VGSSWKIDQRWTIPWPSTFRIKLQMYIFFWEWTKFFTEAYNAMLTTFVSGVPCHISESCFILLYWHPYSPKRYTVNCTWPIRKCNLLTKRVHAELGWPNLTEEPKISVSVRVYMLTRIYSRARLWASNCILYCRIWDHSYKYLQMLSIPLI
jgi:hypothetical protein